MSRGGEWREWREWRSVESGSVRGSVCSCVVICSLLSPFLPRNNKPQKQQKI